MTPLPSIAIIGAGPRGTSLIERIGAHLRAADDAGAAPRPLELHLIEESAFGAGRIWRTDQTRELCMNTLADAVTLFTEPTSSIAGPVREGPTLYEWGLLALARESATGVDGPSGLDPALSEAIARIPATHAAQVDAHPIRTGFAAEYRAELAAFRPETHPSRALYGEYLEWCLERAVSELPAAVRVVRHTGRAVSITRVGAGRERIELAGGERIDADAVALATGWMPRADTETERELGRQVSERPELVWVRPGSPVEQDLSGVPERGNVIVRGLGMGFFDTMALLTLGRGGEFEDDATAPGGLRYLQSGREPIMHVTSGRGVPFRAKTLYGSLPPRSEQRFLLGVDWSREARPIDFDRQFWPRIVADAYFDHYRTLRRVRAAATTAPAEIVESVIGSAIQPHTVAGGEAHAPGAGEPLTAVVSAVAAAVAEFVPDPADRLDLLSEMRPVAHPVESAEEFDDWVVQRVARDLAEAELGRDSALKAGLWSVSSARGVANRVGSLGGFDAESRKSGFAMLQAVGGMAGSGPPAFRTRQLLALAAVGLVKFIGPAARVRVSDRGFTAASPLVADSEVTSSTLIDAWMHFHDLAETADPLAQSLVRAGRARAFRISDRLGGTRATGAFDVDPATGLLVHPGGERDTTVHVAGIPVDEQLHDTIISPMPGTDPPMLRETDRVARSLVEIALRAAANSRTLEGAPSA
ncbi:FAD/NAD(P)-binding protein [Leucobacter sp. NPDC058333]|uniref:FAD/NAD(P)-binding protein n=1 Tax=Leucobacter sp. NPDC058333 TaxID=3346450 RepID=UPI003665BA2D